MIPKGLFAQIAMVLVSIAIIVTYVQPAFSEIGEVQDSIAVYRQERDKVLQVNGQLKALLETQKSVSLVDQNKLLTYMPDADNIDTIAVPRDLALIALQAGVLYRSAAFEGANETNIPEPATDGTMSVDTLSQYPKPYVFSFSVEGTYNQLKNLFLLMEQNHYPLELTSLTVRKVDGSFLTVNMQLTTYAYQSALPDNEIVF
jgi:hypothetical protein